MPTIFEQVIMTAQRTRELREQRYGSLETGVFDPKQNIKSPRLIDQALTEMQSGELDRQYLMHCVKKSQERSTRKPQRRIK